MEGNLGRFFMQKNPRTVLLENQGELIRCSDMVVSTSSEARYFLKMEPPRDLEITKSKED